MNSRITGLVARLDLEQKIRLLTGSSFWTLHDEPAIGLRQVVVSDGPVGIRGQTLDERAPSAVLPSPTGIAASWDEDLVFRLGQLLAGEARCKGVDVVLAPTVNIHRTPRGGQHFECYSEDPYLSGAVGTAMVRGIQSAGIGATAKHFVTNDSETERMTVDVRVDERTLREVYLAPFERMVTEGGAWLVMSAYNKVDGAHMSENPLLSDPLKREWGFDGVVISDWSATHSTEASAEAAQDLVMPGPDAPWGEALLDAVRAGRVTVEAIDDKVTRLLRLAARVGALAEFPKPVAYPVSWTRESVASTLREAAAESMVLIRNDGLLPLDVDWKPRIAVIGQHAVLPRIQGGGSASVSPEKVVTPLEGIRAAFGNDQVDYAMGLRSITALQPFTGEQIDHPDSGSPGWLRVRFLDAFEGVVREESRASGRLLWLGDPVLVESEIIEVTTVFTARVGGEHFFGCSGLGGFEVRIDGVTTISEKIGPGDRDLVATLLDPPTRWAGCELETGQRVDLVLRYRRDPDLLDFPAVSFTLGVTDPYGTADQELGRAVAAAATADVAVVVVGTTDILESEGMDRATLELPPGQDELVRRIVEANPKTVVLVNSGAPVVMPWLDDAAATLLTWFGGQEIGSAIADVLTGAREPGGRLPTTWPANHHDVPVWQVEPTAGTLTYSEGLHVGYREWLRRAETGGPAPAAGFGTGVGYPDWTYSNPSVSTRLDSAGRLDGLLVRITVSNVGGRAGKDVAQVYLSRTSDSAVERPVWWLAGQPVVRLPAEASEIVTVEIPLRALQHWSVDYQEWVTEPGDYLTRIGRSVHDIRSELPISL
ncbi:beta-glucosidase [Nocardia sp. NPDC003963]